jgi:hypothetical protein
MGEDGVSGVCWDGGLATAGFRKVESWEGAEQGAVAIRARCGAPRGARSCAAAAERKTRSG